jgi:hypothetical protein
VSLQKTCVIVLTRARIEVVGYNGEQVFKAQHTFTEAKMNDIENFKNLVTFLSKY